MGGGDPEDSGSAGGIVMRGWMDVKSALTNGGGTAIIAACESGEEIAVAAHDWAVNRNLSGQTRAIGGKAGSKRTTIDAGWQWPELK